MVVAMVCSSVRREAPPYHERRSGGMVPGRGPKRGTTMTHPPLPAGYLSADDIAAYLGITLETFYKNRSTGRGAPQPPLDRIRGRLGISRTAFEQWKADQAALEAERRRRSEQAEELRRMAD